jgi:hypothetical protein
MGAAGPASPSSASSTTPQGEAPPSHDGQMMARALPRSLPMCAFNGVKVFSASKFAERDRLGDVVTQWLAEHPGLDVVDIRVTQSSDAEFHCLTISVFYLDAIAARRVDP